MVEGLDMSLDDLIRKNKAPRLAPPPPPPPPLRRRRQQPPRPTPYPPHFYTAYRTRTLLKPAEMDPEPEGNLYVSNLRRTVSNADIQMLFSEVGEVKRCGIHYDCDGRSQGTAEVVFVRKSDAVAAMKRFNNSPLDGKVLAIELIGPEPVAPSIVTPMPPTVTNWQVAPSIPPSVVPWQMGTLMPQTVPQWQMLFMPQTVPQCPLRPGILKTPNYEFPDREWHHKGRGQRSGQGPIPQVKRLGKVSTKDLDADLEKYLSKRKNITP